MRNIVDGVLDRHPGAAALACPVILLCLASALLAVAYAVVLPTVSEAVARPRVASVPHAQAPSEGASR